MSELSIRVEGLGKRYRIGGKQEPYSSLRDTITDAVTAPFRRAGRLLRGDAHGAADLSQELWAVRGVSFEVPQGDVVGVIGRNGAGKSTLLKLLSRITEPTEGYAEIHGRVGSLLEVGTGFHPELTGRDNIYLNGAILGMRREEINRKFDEIVDFAEVERFIDTPVKHYSSGMYLRLAFAVAAHLEPEILLVDEVLAVGDASFQKKCLGKMGDVAKQGRTVLFVSHSMAAVQNLCTTGLVLSAGGVVFNGPIDEAIRTYLTGDDVEGGIVDLTTVRNRIGTGDLRMTRFWVEEVPGTPGETLASGDSAYFVVEYESTNGEAWRDVGFTLHINTLAGAPVSLIGTYYENAHFETAPARGRIRIEIPRLPLTAGRYVVDLNLTVHGSHTYADFLKGVAAFTVRDGDYFGTGRAGNPGAPVMMDSEWRIEEF